jgi:hypothetical protein
MGKKMGNPRSHPNWPDTILEAKTILDLVDNELTASVEVMVHEGNVEIEEVMDADPVYADEEPSAEAEGDDVDLDDLL